MRGESERKTVGGHQTKQDTRQNARFFPSVNVGGQKEQGGVGAKKVHKEVQARASGRWTGLDDKPVGKRVSRKSKGGVRSNGS